MVSQHLKLQPQPFIPIMALYRLHVPLPAHEMLWMWLGLTPHCPQRLGSSSVQGAMDHGLVCAWTFVHVHVCARACA